MVNFCSSNTFFIGRSAIGVNIKYTTSQHPNYSIIRLCTGNTYCILVVLGPRSAREFFTGRAIPNDRNILKYCVFPNSDEIKSLAERWRPDKRCGDKTSLPYGSFAECNPDGKNPCCGRPHGKCGSGFEFDCDCPDCVDYRVVKRIRESGRLCDVMQRGGFLKYGCFDDEKKQFEFKCPHSNQFYTVDTAFNDKTLENVFHSVSSRCDDDPYAFQACGFTSEISNSDVACGGYFCEQGGMGQPSFIRCKGEGCKVENRDCKANKANICDDKCDTIFSCEDELECGGYRYSLVCKIQQRDVLMPVNLICDGKKNCPTNNWKEENCDISGFHDTETCLHYNTRVRVPIFNYTRCFLFDLDKMVFPYCLDYREQTNCSDAQRVGGYCLVDGYRTSISKYVVCKGLHLNLCDDGLENECVAIETANSDCNIHKHRLCDGIIDCLDGKDENMYICNEMSKKVGLICTRRFTRVNSQFGIPLTWIMDNVTDCENNEDEEENQEIWKICQGLDEETQLILSAGEKCQNVFKCPEGGHVHLEQLCDGVESCKDGENKICRIARDLPVIDTIASTNGSAKKVCNGAFCERESFKRRLIDVFGVTNVDLIVPPSKVSCKNFFGEQYLFLSCMDLCLEPDAICYLEIFGSTLMHDSCPGQYQDRVYTFTQNNQIKFAIKGQNGQYHQDLFQCKNSRCIEYKQVCDLVDNCGDMSDEVNCTNHMICEDTMNKKKLQFISLSQKCDGIYDCFDLSDECNESCHKEILGSLVLKVICWLMGILAIVLNSGSVFRGLVSLKEFRKKPTSLMVLYNKTLVTLVGCGDFLIGIYLVVLSVYDSIIYRDKFCRNQAKWLTGNACLTLGVVSTIGSQVSLFSMTILSVIRMVAMFRRSMTHPHRLNLKSCLSSGMLVLGIVLASLAIACVPLLPPLEDYFVQGVYYDPSYKVFVGFPNKEKHIAVLKAYYNQNKTENTTRRTADMTWREIGEEIDGMFTQNPEYGQLTRSPVHFYGNDGVCLFKYFVRTDDARRSRNNQGADREAEMDIVVWLMLALNLLCFIVMSISYIVMAISRVRSSKRMGKGRNKKDQKLQRKITIIIMTDFLCWVPLIIISALHNLRQIDASEWYIHFAMIVLPLNSVINPLIYEDYTLALMKKNVRKLKRLSSTNWSTQASVIQLEKTIEETAAT